MGRVAVIALLCVMCVSASDASGLKVKLRGRPRAVSKAADPTVEAIGQTLMATAVHRVERRQEHAIPADSPRFQLRQAIQGSKGLAHATKRLERKVDEDILRQDAAGDRASSVKADIDTVLHGVKMSDLDTDGDGFLENQELREQMRKLLPALDRLEEVQERNLQRKDLNELFASMDTSHDNLLQFNEVYGGHMSSPRFAAFEKEEHFRFDLSDGDHDGNLTRGEFFQFQNPRFLSPRSQYYMLLAREEMKADHVDLTQAKPIITWDAYRKGLVKESTNAHPFAFGILDHTTSRLDKASMMRELKKHWIKLQKPLSAANRRAHSGSTQGLTMAQLSKFIQIEMQKDTVSRAMRRVVKAADDNQDGKLSLEEIMANAKHFGDSDKQFFLEKAQLVHKIGVCNTIKRRKSAICIRKLKHRLPHHHSSGP